MKILFPVLMIIFSVGAAVVYFIYKDFYRALYFFAGALITFAAIKIGG